MSELRCDKCEWWHNIDRESGGTPGECRSFPPIVTRDTGGCAISSYPITEPYDWCGEFKQKE